MSSWIRSCLTVRQGSRRIQERRIGTPPGLIARSSICSRRALLRSGEDMRSSILIALLVTAIAVAQDPSAPAIPVVTVAVAPLAPPDLNSPYASPRDGARHRLQATLSDLSATRNIKEALRGFAEAFLTDRTYAVAAFDMGILATIAEKWDDSAGAFEEVLRIDP